MTAQRRSFVDRQVRKLEAAPQPSQGDDRIKLFDLSLLPRWGLKGRGAFSWLGDEGATAPIQDNLATRQPDGSIVARLSPGEALILSSIPDGEAGLAHAIASLPSQGRGSCYPVPRSDSHAWFLVAGADIPRMLAKLCAVDLSADRFPDGAIAQTSVARLSAIVLRNDLAGALAFSLLSDSASAQYLWECLLDAMEEFSGAAARLETIGAA